MKQNIISKIGRLFILLPSPLGEGSGVRLLVFILHFSFFIFATAQSYNVRDFGAKGDGKHLDSPAINAAIEKAAADGGGTIFLPAGNYLCGSIHMKSNIRAVQLP